MFNRSLSLALLGRSSVLSKVTGTRYSERSSSVEALSLKSAACNLKIQIPIWTKTGTHILNRLLWSCKQQKVVKQDWHQLLSASSFPQNARMQNATRTLDQIYSGAKYMKDQVIQYQITSRCRKLDRRLNRESNVELAPCQSRHGLHLKTLTS